MEFFKAILLACGSAFVTGLFTLVLSNITYKREQKKKKDMRYEQILTKLDGIENKLNRHIADDERNRVEEGRTRFLRFGDECRRGILHTEEHWNDIMKDIDIYKDFCRHHEDYKNERAVRTIDYLLEKYDEHIKNNTFLGGKAQ